MVILTYCCGVRSRRLARCFVLCEISHGSPANVTLACTTSTVRSVIPEVIESKPRPRLDSWHTVTEHLHRFGLVSHACHTDHFLIGQALILWCPLAVVLALLEFPGVNKAVASQTDMSLGAPEHAAMPVF